MLSQQEGCKGLQLIFDDVLEAQRIEQGRLRLRDEVVDVTRVLDSIVATFHRTAESQGIELRASVGEGVPGHIRGDGVRTKQVLANLVSNALKFTKRGGTVGVSLTTNLISSSRARSSILLQGNEPNYQN